jgi:hypothetical protein
MSSMRAMSLLAVVIVLGIAQTTSAASSKGNPEAGKKI